LAVATLEQFAVLAGESTKVAITAAAFTPCRYSLLIGFGYQGEFAINLEKRKLSLYLVMRVTHYALKWTPLNRFQAIG